MLNLYEVTIVTNKRSQKGFYTGESSKEAREDAKFYFRNYDMEDEEYLLGTVTALVNEDL